MKWPRFASFALAAASLAVPLAAADFYASPTGTSAGDGSKAKPWTLGKALAQPSTVKPGDTIWLRGGTYAGHWASYLKGTAAKPIVVRQYPGERATIDGNYGGNGPTFDFRGAYTWFWGFEITNSDTNRVSAAPEGPALKGTAMNLLSPGSKLINLAIHDTAQGVLTTAVAPDIEINGCLIYYNGYDGPDRGHGHAIYAQNETGFKRLVDNILFAQFGYGVHSYTESGKLDNLYLEGNTSFNNGILSQVSGLTTNFLIGANGAAATSADSSGKVAKNTSLIHNYSYFSGSGGTGVNLGYSKGIASPTILDNYLVGAPALALVNAFRPIQMSGNTIDGSLGGFAASEFPSNTYVGARPTGVRVFVRPNHYEPGRANITVFNWDRAPSVAVSLKGILRAGTAYEVRNAQNFFGLPVLSGTYDGSSSLQLPMNDLAPAAPVGWPAPAPTGPDFQVFVVVPRPADSVAKPPAASFSFGPRGPVAGETVAFANRTADAVSSRLWDFGDPASGEQNASDSDRPSHTFSAGGSYTVRLTVTNDGVSSTRSREISVADSPGSRAARLTVAGHVRGATGTTFVTDLSIQNTSSTGVSAKLFFTPSGGDPPLEKTLTLAGRETRVVPDVVAALFGLDNALGSIRMVTEGTPPAALRLASRTYVDDGGATLGLGTVGVSATDDVRGDRFLSNVAISEAYRTNFGALNPTDVDLPFALQLLDVRGNIVGRTNLSLAPGAQHQWALAELFPSVTGSGFTARIAPPIGVLAPLAYAAMTDNASSDPTYYGALAPSPVHFVPGIAGITGVGDAHFRSEISIANSGHGPAAVTVTFLEHDRDNTTAPATTFVLGPYETFHADDALQTLFGVTETYGALRVESDASPGITVFERILTDSTMTAGTVGQQVDALSAEDLPVRGALLGARQDDAFRSNIGLVNPNAAVIAVTLTLVRPPSTVIGTATVLLAPFGYVQRNLAALFPSAALSAGEVMSLTVDGGGQPAFAFASVIDNASQDPTYFPELP